MTYYKYPVNKIGVTSDYGFRSGGFHYGLDLGWFDYHGEEIYSIGNGEVISKGYSDTSGHYVTIKHSNEDKSSYLHLRESSKLNIGDIVSMGTLVGYMGETGNATGVHLHVSFQRNNEYIDPKTVLYVYPNQYVSDNTKNNYNILYYEEPVKPINEIDILKNKIKELEDKLLDYKFKYTAPLSGTYKIKLNKDENLIIK